MARSSRKAAPDSVEPASGNAFKDLGFPDAEERTAKVALAVEFNRIVKTRRLTQAAAAKLVGVTQPKISAVTKYNLDGFSVERLMGFLTALGQDVDITIRAGRSDNSHGPVRVAAE